MFLNQVTIGIKVLKDHSEECHDGETRRFKSGKIYINKMDFKTKTLPNGNLLLRLTAIALKDQKIEFLPELFCHRCLCLN